MLVYSSLEGGSLVRLFARRYRSIKGCSVSTRRCRISFRHDARARNTSTYCITGTARVAVNQREAERAACLIALKH